MPKKPQKTRPTAEDAARRLVVLKYVIVHALSSLPRDTLLRLFEEWGADDRRKFTADDEARRDEFWRPLHQSGLWRHVSPAEREWAGTTAVTMTPQQQMNATWRIEAAQVLLWALGLISRLPAYDAQADHDFLNQIPLRPRDIPDFVASARLRTDPELDRARADAELWHWRSRTRQLIEDGREFGADEHTKAAGFSSYDDIVRFTASKLAEEGRIAVIDEDFTAKGKAYRKLSDAEWSEVRSITMERHFALNWLCGHAPRNKWDDTPTDT